MSFKCGRRGQRVTQFVGGDEFNPVRIVNKFQVSPLASFIFWQRSNVDLFGSPSFDPDSYFGFSNKLEPRVIVNLFDFGFAESLGT